MPTEEDQLYLRVHGRVLEHLGIQMYQSPVNALAELIANSWDAEAEEVRIYLPDELTEDATIVVEDDGLGMTKQECQDRYLIVGWNRRGDDPDEKSPNKDRPILGRKGIGKFAGFGIAKVIEVDTISQETGERTVFQLSLDDLTGEEYIGEGEKPVPILTHLEPDGARKEDAGTTVTLSSLTLKRNISHSQFLRSMSRRFLLPQRQADFEVFVDGDALPEDSFETENVQYVFPRDYPEEDLPASVELSEEDSGWGIEELDNGESIRWRFIFYEDTIDDEELRGVSIFAKEKLVQAPFLFHLAGGLGGQHGVEYLTGQVEADFVDLLPEDVIATERQRLNWQHEATQPLLGWGQERVKKILRIWQDLRAEKRREQIEDKVAEFSDRLDKLPSHERKTVDRALKGLARISTLSDTQFNEMGDGILTAWEQGRLRELISDISESEEMSVEEFLSLLAEANILTALNVAEAVKTKLDVIKGLEERIRGRELENDLRDYVADNPWLLRKDWETFSRERGVRGLMEDAADEAGLTDNIYNGRIDLALSSGPQLVIVEFMRPGLRLDWDHINRCERYVLEIRSGVRAKTGCPFEYVPGYVIADRVDHSSAMVDKIDSLRDSHIYTMDWPELLRQAKKQWEDFSDALAQRAPDDARLQAVTNESPDELS